MGRRLRAAKELERVLLDLGYQFDRLNTKGRKVYVRAGHADVPVLPTISEREAKFLIQKLQRQHGIKRETNKRNATIIKERQGSARERIKAETEALNRELLDIMRRKDALPVGDLDEFSRSERVAIEHEITRITAERRKWESLMTELPVPLNNSSTHTAGGSQ
jgi:hypothetical protein